MPVNRDHQGEADRCFRRGDGDGKDRDHDACGRGCLRAETPERDEIQVCRGEHQLDADENKDGVAPAQRGQQSDAEQSCGNDEKELESWGHVWERKLQG